LRPAVCLRPLGFGAATSLASQTGWWARQHSNLQPDPENPENIDE